MAITDEKVRKRFMEVATNGRITCKQCFMVAGEFGLEKKEIASTLTEMDIKIVGCQLGCFP